MPDNAFWLLYNNWNRAFKSLSRYDVFNFEFKIRVLEDSLKRVIAKQEDFCHSSITRF